MTGQRISWSTPHLWFHPSIHHKGSADNWRSCFCLLFQKSVPDWRLTCYLVPSSRGVYLWTTHTRTSSGTAQSKMSSAPPTKTNSFRVKPDDVTRSFWLTCPCDTQKCHLRFRCPAVSLTYASLKRPNSNQGVFSVSQTEEKLVDKVSFTWTDGRETFRVTPCDLIIRKQAKDTTAFLRKWFKLNISWNVLFSVWFFKFSLIFALYKA